jgi:formylglycine-generating enzyme required for sulfatase activity
MPLVFIPAGTFLRGAPAEDLDSEANERPQAEVVLDAFWIDQTEVTNRMYSLCVLEGGCQPPQSPSTLTRAVYYEDLAFAEYPVVNVNWEQAHSYCRWTGRRLPSEAEWEKAARGRGGARFPWGDGDPNCDLLNFGNPGPGRGACSSDTTTVGSFPLGASPYGALDMAGNVFEWVADWYQPNAYRASSLQNPNGPESGETRVLRGGALNDAAGAVRASNRHHTHPENISYFIGFRCAISAEP